MITDEQISCWKTNYGLDKRSPQEAAAAWLERSWCNGMVPPGSVAALGLCIQEIERLRVLCLSREICPACGSREPQNCGHNGGYSEGYYGYVNCRGEVEK
jgi:hypothetical protein